ncbi:MAG: hypothetical protein WAW50_05330, partial [Trichococcus flocculiformis]
MSKLSNVISYSTISPFPECRLSNSGGSFDNSRKSGNLYTPFSRQQPRSAHRQVILQALVSRKPAKMVL